MSESVLKNQVGGNHYLVLAIQPFEFALTNSWDAAAFSILKYITRHRNKNGIEDLRKARHIVEIRQKFIQFIPGRWTKLTIPMQHYIDVNKIENSDAIALQVLDKWVTRRTVTHQFMLEVIDVLIAETENHIRNDSLYSGHELGI